MNVECASDSALVKRVHEEMAALTRAHTVAIVAQYEGVPHQHATGTLVRFADQWLLVTASHAIKYYREGQELYPDLHLLLENGISSLIPLGGKYWATDRVNDRERPVFTPDGDLWDIALWSLDQATVRDLTNKSFLNRSDISITAALTSGLYYVAGFPSVWGHPNIEDRTINFGALGYIANPHPCPTDLDGFDASSHIALSLSPSEEMPELEGISGCSIWKISDGPLGDDWTSKSAKVVAVQTGVYTKVARKAVKGTKWSCVVRAMGLQFPELRSSFDVWLPGRE